MDTIQEYVKRPERYVNVDGLNEIVAGVVFIAFEVGSWWSDKLPRESLGHLLRALLWIPVALLAYFGAAAIRKRITYRRTGFMKLRREGTAVMVAVVAGGVAIALWYLVAWWLGVLPGDTRLLFDPVLVGICGFSAVAVYSARISEQAKWKWIIALVMACGLLAVCLVPAERSIMWLRSFAVLGAGVLISGGISFYLYLRHTEAVSEAE
jgi:hypothetical protein